MVAIFRKCGEKTQLKKKLFNLYYDSDEEKTLWDMQDQHLDELTEEVFAEELRLLYVALTRAKISNGLCVTESL